MENYRYNVVVTLDKSHDRGLEATKLMVAIEDAITGVLGEAEGGTILIQSPEEKAPY